MIDNCKDIGLPDGMEVPNRQAVQRGWVYGNYPFRYTASFTGGKPRNYHEIALTLFCSQATSGTHRGSVQAENWIKKRWCHFHFCFILQLRTNNGEIRQCGSV